MSIVERLPVDPGVGAGLRTHLQDCEGATIARVLDVSSEVAEHIKAGTADVTVAEVWRLAHLLSMEPYVLLGNLVRRQGEGS